MAPGAQTLFIDPSGYTPSSDIIKELKWNLRLSHATYIPNASWVSQGPQIIDSLDQMIDGESSVLQLSLSDLKEIEDAFTKFKCTFSVDTSTRFATELY